jgi:hypothetical protein
MASQHATSPPASPPTSPPASSSPASPASSSAAYPAERAILNPPGQCVWGGGRWLGGLGGGCVMILASLPIFYGNKLGGVENMVGEAVGARGASGGGP